MLYRKEDLNNDYVFGSGLSDFHINTPDGVAQAVKTRLGLWSGEWFLDVDEGTPYLTGIIGKYSLDSINQIMSDRILSTQGVIEIVEYNGVYDGNNRSYTINVTISTLYGTANVYGVF